MHQDGIQAKGAVADDTALHSDIVWIPGGTFQMGSNARYPEEQAVQQKLSLAFGLKNYTPTNEQFAPLR